jgi:hypothetical protein
MEVSEWAAIEDGYVPQTTAQLRSIAGTLEISYDRLLNLVQAAQWGEARD